MFLHKQQPVPDGIIIPPFISSGTWAGFLSRCPVIQDGIRYNQKSAVFQNAQRIFLMTAVSTTIPQKDTISHGKELL